MKFSAQIAAAAKKRSRKRTHPQSRDREEERAERLLSIDVRVCESDNKLVKEENEMEWKTRRRTERTNESDRRERRESLRESELSEERKFRLSDQIGSRVSLLFPPGGI